MRNELLAKIDLRRVLGDIIGMHSILNSYLKGGVLVAGFRNKLTNRFYNRSPEFCVFPGGLPPPGPPRKKAFGPTNKAPKINPKIIKQIDQTINQKSDQKLEAKNTQRGAAEGGAFCVQFLVGLLVDFLNHFCADFIAFLVRPKAFLRRGPGGGSPPGNTQNSGEQLY